jgi:hypothetical protein
MTIPYIPGWGDTLAKDLPQIGKNISQIVSPAQPILEAIAANPQLMDAYKLLYQANPHLAEQLGGPKLTDALAGGTVTQPVSNQLAIQGEKVKQEGSNTEIAKNAADASKFEPQRALLGIQIQQGDLAHNQHINTLLEQQVNDTIAGKGLVPFSLGKLIRGEYTPQEEAQYYAAAGPAIADQVKMYLGNLAAQTAVTTAGLKGHGLTTELRDDAMRSLTAANTRLSEIDRLIGSSSISGAAKEALRNEYNTVSAQRWAWSNLLGQNSTPLQYVKKERSFLPDTWSQQVVNPDSLGWKAGSIVGIPQLDTPTTPEVKPGEASRVPFNVGGVAYQFDPQDAAAAKILEQIPAASLPAALAAMKEKSKDVFDRLPKELQAMAATKKE